MKPKLNSINWLCPIDLPDLTKKIQDIDGVDMLFLITPLIKTKNPGNYILNKHKHILKGGEKKGMQK